MAAIAGGTSGTPAPNPANINYAQYTASGIVFAKATEANLATALTINAAEDSLTDVFKPVTLATGKITSCNTSSNVVQGTATSFLIDFEVGDYMFYYTASASPVLLGKVSSVDSDTQITLTSFASTTITSTPGAYCGKTNEVIGVGEQILMRVPVVPYTSTQVYMPNWNAYRIQSGVATSYNLTTRSNMQTFSQVNNPSVATNTPVNVPYTIKPIWNYDKKTASNGYDYVFLSSSAFPNYAYALLNPYGNSTVDNLAANTLFKFFASETFANNGILVGTNYPVLFLTTAGY